MTPRVRLARPEDATHLARVYVASWRAAYRDLMPPAYLAALSEEAEADRWTQTIGDGPARGRHTFVVASADSLSGLALVGPDREDGALGLLFLMYVHPEHWGTGLGYPLLAASENSLREQGFAEARLWVLEDNQRARSFYERYGWHPDGTRAEDDYGGRSLPALRYLRNLRADT